MKNINNLKKRFIKLLPSTVLASAAFLFLSCDYSYELAEENSKEDSTPPAAFFGATVRGDDEWNITDFANGSTSANTYEWNFGDGETSDELEPSHSYPGLLGEAKDYTVTLTATDANGLSDVYTSIVTIEDNGIALGDLELFYDLINTAENSPVTIHSYSSFQESANHFPSNILDKDPGTKWTAEDGVIPEGDYKSDGEYLIFDLGATSNLQIIRFRTDAKDFPYGYQVWTSDSDTQDSSFTQLLPVDGDLMFSEAGNTDFQLLTVDVSARYVKLIGFGRFNVETNVRESVWTNFTEIEFFKTQEE